MHTTCFLCVLLVSFAIRGTYSSTLDVRLKAWHYKGDNRETLVENSKLSPVIMTFAETVFGLLYFPVAV